MDQRIARHDWARTPLGPPQAWPLSLRLAVRLMLSTRHPVMLYWGAQLRCLYNDAFVPLMGSDKHPAILGQPGAEAWAEAWPLVGRQIEAVAGGGAATWNQDMLVPITRDGRQETAWWTFSCSPVDDPTAPNGIGGVLVLCTETTEAVLSRRDAEARRRESEAEARRQRRLYEAILTNTPDLAYVWDRHHRFIYANEVLLRMWGRSWEDAIGRHCLELGYEPWHAAMHDREIEDVIATRRPVQGTVPFHGTFGRRLYEYILVPVIGADGQVEAVAGTTRDVTDRLAADLALRAAEERRGIALAAAQLGTFDWHLASNRVTLDDRSRAILGFAPDQGGTAQEVFDRIHPEDFPRVHAQAMAAASGLQRLETEYRVLLPDGSTRIVASLSDAVSQDGTAERMVGVLADVTERRAAEARQALLAREVDHRAKNALAVVQSVLRLTRAPDIASFKEAVEGRVAALARVQTLLAEDRWTGASLQALLEGELAPFRTDANRILLDGPPLALPPGAAQPLAMAAHELATNAVKYGALSVPGGRVAVDWIVAEGARLVLRWTESGGPAIATEPARRGFGSRVLDGTIRGQLGGDVAKRWPGSGLVCTLQVPLGQEAADRHAATESEDAAAAGPAWLGP